MMRRARRLCRPVHPSARTPTHDTHAIATGVPRQPAVPDKLRDGGDDGHAEYLPAEFGIEAKVRLGLVNRAQNPQTRGESRGPR